VSGIRDVRREARLKGKLALAGGQLLFLLLFRCELLRLGFCSIMAGVQGCPGTQPKYFPPGA
jgi:hypothetical protein